MKKVAIITIYDNYNFGNRLQNYALQQVIKNLGFDVDTIINKPISNNVDILWNFRLFLRRIYFKDYTKKNKRRKKMFEEFSNQYISTTSKVLYTNKENYDDLDDYDYYIIGSDQIWNYNFRTNTFGKFEFGLFSKKEKCFSYAASFGITSIPTEQKKTYILGLNNLFQISVREDAGKDIVLELTNRNIDVHIDPTMLLDECDWNCIMKRPNSMLEEPYILLYFLGGVSDTRLKAIRNYTEENNLKIISMLDRNCKYYESGPSEFIYLVKNAYMICTDSFHACVFSIIFNKPFLVYSRDRSNREMNSRIKTLLHKFEIEGREYNTNSFSNDVLKVDYTKAKKVLEYERLKAKNYLKSCLNLESN